MRFRIVRDVIVAAVAFVAFAALVIAPTLDRGASQALSGPTVSAPAGVTPTLPPNPALPTAGQGVPTFRLAPAPYGLALAPSCVIQERLMHQDELGAVWRIQCGSAAANLGIASGADAQGWHFENGDRPDGFQNFTQGDLLMQVVYRRDGPAAADQVTVVQQFRQPTNGADYPDGFGLAGACSTYGAPVKRDATSRTWLGRCGGDMAKAWDQIGQTMTGFWGFVAVGSSSPTYTTRAWCGKTQIFVQWGAGLAPGVFTMTQTTLAAPGTCIGPGVLMPTPIPTAKATP